MFLLLLLLLAALSISSTDSDFSCTGPGMAAWSEDDRKEILEVHNWLRTLIREGKYVTGTKALPGTTYAKEITILPAKKDTYPNMTYNCTVEMYAQRYADKKPTPKIKHSKPDERPGMGENLYWRVIGKDKRINGTGALASKAWADEIDELGWPCNRFVGGGVWKGLGHATAMAWAKTTSVGCGTGVYLDGEFTTVVVVCQYYPEGNMIGANIYEADVDPRCPPPRAASCLPLVWPLILVLLPCCHLV